MFCEHSFVSASCGFTWRGLTRQGCIVYFMAVWLFDLDGTLVDRLPSLEAFLPEQYKKYGAGKPLAESYTRRFLELERNGHASKHEVYQTLIDEFRLNASEKN